MMKRSASYKRLAGTQSPTCLFATTCSTSDSEEYATFAEKCSTVQIVPSDVRKDRNSISSSAHTSSVFGDSRPTTYNNRRITTMEFDISEEALPIVVEEVQGNDDTFAHTLMSSPFYAEQQFSDYMNARRDEVISGIMHTFLTEGVNSSAFMALEVELSVLDGLGERDEEIELDVGDFIEVEHVSCMTPSDARALVECDAFKDEPIVIVRTSVPPPLPTVRRYSLLPSRYGTPKIEDVSEGPFTD